MSDLKEANRKRELVKATAAKVNEVRSRETVRAGKDIAEADVMVEARKAYGPDADVDGFDLAVERYRADICRQRSKRAA